MASRISRFDLTCLSLLLLSACQAGAGSGAGAGLGAGPAAVDQAPAALSPSEYWNAATVYFLLLDRFANGDPGNDTALGRRHDGAVLRNFEGGDLRGLLQSIESGYFDSLGVTAIWMTPFVEQIHGAVDEGTGKTYGFHGYWTRDWTAVDPAFGTEADLRAVVDAAHRRGMRVLMDAVINHTGHITAEDPVWPDDWVRTGPQCTYRDYATTVHCTLVPVLQDIRTDRDQPVDLPPNLLAKWDREGRRGREVAELNDFFHRTGYPRAPRYYVIKWLTDWVREFGFDGYRLDTAKHFDESVSAELKLEASRAYEEWKRAHPGAAPDALPFYMVGEVYGYDIGHGRLYDFGDRKVNYFAHGYDALINFGFKSAVRGSLDTVFTRYAAALHGGPLDGFAVLNYVSSHDDGGPYDRDRRDPLGAGTRLLLAPGGAQIYYGDELARPLTVPGAEGDANLRSLMSWEDTATVRTREILAHWRRLGQFRARHPAVGAGVHRTLQSAPLIFTRTLEHAGSTDRVLVALGQPEGAKSIPVFGVFPEGTVLRDEYSGSALRVQDGRVVLTSPGTVVLLSRPASVTGPSNPSSR